MIYPTIILDNFFEDPIKVIQFAKSLEYYPNDEGRWPGQRTKELHEVDKYFFEKCSYKILSILYPTIKKINFNCSLQFQKISNEYINEGWIHQDFNFDFTTIVYLSRHNECGTSLFNSKKVFCEIINGENRKIAYTNKNFKEEIKYLNENNNQFTETVKINSKFNRLIMFDSSQYHSAQKFIENNIEEDRLTLIGFFKDIYFPGIKFNGIEHKKII